MLPKYTALFEAHRAMCAQRGIHYGARARDDVQIAIARAKLEAAKLAGDRVEDEPAALLFALLVEGEALGELRDAFPVVAVRLLLQSGARRALPLTLPDRIALRVFRARALASPTDARLVFDELRAFVAARLRPLP